MQVKKWALVKRDTVIYKRASVGFSVGHDNLKAQDTKMRIKYLQELGELPPNETDNKQKIKKSYSRTKSNLKDIIENNVIPNESIFLTCTTAKKLYKRTEIMALHRYFINKQVPRCALQAVDYVAVIEKHQDKSFHLHYIIFNGVKLFKPVKKSVLCAFLTKNGRYIKPGTKHYHREIKHYRSEVLDNTWLKNGTYDIKIIKDPDASRIAGYYMKYLTKSDLLQNGKKFLASKNLLRTFIEKDFELIKSITQSPQIDSAVYNSLYHGVVIETVHKRHK